MSGSWKALRRLRFAPLAWALAVCAAPPDLRRDLLHDGDIIFQQSQTQQSEAIRQATGSPWTHVGVLWRDEQGRWLVYEASGAAVRTTPLDGFTGRSAGRRIVIKRLRDGDQLLAGAAHDRLKRSLESFLGRPYDVRFSWDERSVYCSELVWKAYRRGVGAEISPVSKVAALEHEAPIVQGMIRERRALQKGTAGYDRLMDEPIVTPADLLASDRLVDIYPSR